MSTNNKVFQVLVTKGNQALAARGAALDALLPGQLGFYDADSNLAVDGTEVPLPRSFYAALGLGSGATLTNVRFSAGQEIQTKNILNYTYQANEPAVASVFEISEITAKCGEDYSLKVSVTSPQIMNIFGFRPYDKTYSVQTACCKGCEPCPSGSKAELAVKLVKEINKDKDAYFTAQLFSGKPSLTLVADLNAYMANPANKDVDVTIRITAKPGAIIKGDNIPQPLGFDTAAIKMFLGTGFDCAGTVKQTVVGKQEEGLGHYIKEREYIAAGYNGNGSLYRTSGQFNESWPEATLLADTNVKYDQFNLVHDHHSKSGWLDYLNNQNTLIAVPAADAATRTALFGVLNKLGALSGQKPLAVVSDVNDAADETANI